MIMLFVFLVIVTNYRVLGNTHVLLKNTPAKLGVSADVAVVEYDAPVDLRSGMNVNVPAQNGIPDLATGDDAAAGED
jgi:S1-C subfamily serine protease